MDIEKLKKENISHEDHMNDVLKNDEYQKMYLNTAIQEFISDFVEDCNNEGVFPISNLSRALENKFTIIKFIEFNGINGKYIQKVMDYSYNQTVDELDMEDFVPEFMNVRKTLNLVSNENVSQKTYKYSLTISYK